MRSWIGFFAVASAVTFFAGCATVTKTDTNAGAQPAPTASTKTTKAAVSKDSLKIEKGQTLWGISKSVRTYNKSCQWPVLYKANKEKIQDPDLIYPGQVLMVPHGVAPTDGSNACKAAAKYGKYQPHTKPRTDVQVDY